MTTKAAHESKTMHLTLLRKLTVALRKRDPHVEQAARKIMSESTATASAFSPTDPALLALAHQRSHKVTGRPMDERCVACAISSAIWLCLTYDVDKRRRRFVIEHRDIRRDIDLAIGRYGEAIGRLTQPEAPSERMRLDHLAHDEARRRDAPSRARQALARLAVAARSLDNVIVDLFPCDLFGDVRSATWKPGPAFDTVSDAVIEHLHQWKLTYAGIEEITGHSVEAMKARRWRRRQGVRGPG